MTYNILSFLAGCLVGLVVGVMSLAVFVDRQSKDDMNRFINLKEVKK